MPQDYAPITDYESSRRQRRDWIAPLLLILVPLYLYVNLFTLKNIPYLLLGDQTFFWTYALRMLHGERIYQDFFQFTPPGTDLFYLALFRFFGPHIWVTNFAVILLGAPLCWICFNLAQRIMERKLALLATVFFLVFVYADRLDATHHWFSLLAALCAVRAVMPQRTLPRILAAGALLGVASFFTQTAGVAGVLALLAALAWEHSFAKQSWRITLKQQMFLCAAFVLAWGMVSAYLIAHVGWRQLWYFQITYPRHYVLYKGEFLLPQLGGPLNRHMLIELAQRLFLWTLVNAIYPMVLWYCWRQRHSTAAQDTMQPVLLCLMGAALWLEIIARVHWNRIYIVSMPAVILVLWAVGRLGKQRRYVAGALWAVTAAVAVRQLWSDQYSPHQILQLPAGKAVVSAQLVGEYSWIAQHTRPGDVFFQAEGPAPYLPLQLHSPAFVDYLWAGEPTRPEFVSLTTHQMDEKQVKYICWSSRDDARRYGQSHLGPFRDFLNSHYQRVQILPDDYEIWERR